MRRRFCAQKQQQHHEEAHSCARNNKWRTPLEYPGFPLQWSQGEIARAAASDRVQCESQGEKKQNKRHAIAITLLFPLPSSKRSTDILFIHTA
jgi:hypothetical protein